MTLLHTRALVPGALAASADIAPSSHDFGSQDVGTPSAPLTFTLNSSHFGPLTLGPITKTGNDTADFSVSSDTCSNQLVSAFGSCTFAITFTPGAAGPRSATISIEHTLGTATATLSGTGSAAAAALTVTPGSRDFGTLGLGVPSAPQTFTVENTGGAAVAIGGLTVVADGAGPTLLIAPQSLDFGAQAGGTTSVPQQVTLINTGDEALAFGSVTLGGPNASDFLLVGEVCAGGVLQPGESCDLGVVYWPQGASASTAVVVVTTGGGLQHTIPLAGNGGTPDTPTSDGTGGATAAQDYALAANTCAAATLQPGTTCTFAVTFTPALPGGRSASVQLASDLPASPTLVPLSGSGSSAAPRLGITPLAADFGAQTVGTTGAQQQFTVTNTGSGDLAVSGVALGGPDASHFAIAGEGCTAAPLAANQSCTIAVTFSPTATGPRHALITLADDAPGEARLLLAGAGTAAPAPAVGLAPTVLSFGTQPVGTPGAPQTVTVTNTGTATLTIGTPTISVGATAFAIESNACTVPLAPTASCAIQVRFTPPTTGAQTGTLAIPSDAASSPESVALSGTGVAPALALSPNGWAFGDVATGATSAPVTITVTNTGDAPLTLGTIALGGAQPGQFALGATTCGATPLAAAASCTIDVTFAPTALGAASASLTVPSDAASSPDSITLTGTGVAPPAPAVSLSPTSVDFGTQATGTTGAAQPVTLTNGGTAPLTIVGIAASGDFAQTNDCAATLAVGAHCTISVTFTPTALGARSGSLTVTSDAASSPDGVALSGSGSAPPLPAVGLTPGSLAFGSQATGTASAPQTLTVTNSGTAPLVLGTLALTGADTNQFTLADDTCSGQPVPVGQSCTVAARFAPTTGGAKSAAVSVPSNAGSSPDGAALTGDGNAAAVATTLAVAPATATYGGTATLSATLRDTNNAPLAGKSVAFTLGGSPVGSATTDGSGVATLPGVPLGGRVVGGYASLVGASFAGDGGALASGGTATLTVTRATLTVTAEAKARTYGVANPALTVAYEGFANDDTATVLTGQPTIATSATAASNVGSYPITVARNTLNAANYDLIFVNGTLAVTPAPLTVTAVDKSRAYGAANPALTVRYTGFKQGDDAGDLGGVPSLATAATPASPAGAYPIVVGQGTLGAGNYSYTFVNGTLTVMAVPTAVSAASGAATYGGTATLTATLQHTGKGGTPIAGATIAFTLGGSPVGSAATDATGVATLTGVALGGRGAGNYAGLVGATFAGDAGQRGDSAIGTLKVAKAALVLRAVDGSRRVGQANPPCQVQLAPGSGFVNGDTLASLDLTGLACTYGSTKTSLPAGTHAITPRGVRSDNYTITYQNGTLTVTP